MTQTVVFNGSSYQIPTSGESGWAEVLTAFLADLGANSSTTTSTAAAVAPLTTLTDTHTTELASLTGTVDSLSHTGRNYLRNPQFTIQSRGAGPFTGSSVYGLDGWVQQHTNGSNSTTAEAVTDVIRGQLADQDATSFLQNTFVGASAGGDYVLLTQRVEDVRRLAGKTCTLSFYASSDSDMSIGVETVQVFGTGGSPSTLVTSIGRSAVAITSTWTRHTCAGIVMPSVSGKTMGSNNDSYTGVIFWLSAGTSVASRASSIGVQSNTVRLWGVQLEVSAAASSLEKRDPATELALNQRYMQVMTLGMQSPAVGSMGLSVPFPVAMRGTPSNTNSVSGTLTNASIANESATDARSVFLQITATSGSGFLTGRVNYYSAEL